ncbi:MAG: ABC transporter ATP-binding protein [Bacilli bacterium]|jgi:ABC-2 type transport system ATP-binding protein|nr:ABC transporter ATP-binding protein [Bacilli bacterium]
MIKLENVVKKYGEKIVIDNVSITFNNHKAYGICGPNGGGKTQLLKLICGFIKANSGNVYQDDIKIRNKNNFIKDAGIIIENPAFIKNLTVLENLELIRKIKEKTNKEELDEYIKYFNLDKYKFYLYKNLSLGTKQKMLIIQALIDRPKILILDEPFNALDQKTCDKFIAYLKEYKKNNLLILCSHGKEEINLICDEIYRIEEGEITNHEKI